MTAPVRHLGPGLILVPTDAGPLETAAHSVWWAAQVLRGRVALIDPTPRMVDLLAQAAGQAASPALAAVARAALEAAGLGCTIEPPRAARHTESDMGDAS